MRWQGGRRSSNVEDRRGRRAVGRGAKLGGVGGIIVVVIAIVMALMGKDPSEFLSAASNAGATGGGATQSGPVAPNPGEDRLADFVSVVLASTEDTWTNVFQSRGQVYQPPRLVLFRGEVDSACGMTSAAVGPFYCPPDKQVYIDLSFFDDLDRRFGAPGDFAQAYVVAHEVGHHLQTLMGISQRVRQQKRGLPEVQANQLSIRQELQADCFAGVWAHHANRRQQILEPGDVEEGMQAASAIGDDTIQRRAHGRVSPESWTHGASEQRVRWFRIGMQVGTIEACDTFNAAQL